MVVVRWRWPNDVGGFVDAGILAIWGYWRMVEVVNRGGLYDTRWEDCGIWCIW